MKVGPDQGRRIFSYDLDSRQKGVVLVRTENGFSTNNSTPQTMLPSWSSVCSVILSISAVVFAQQDGRPPNIVLILTDDQDLRMNSLDHMPNVQRLLIDEGTFYTRHYAPTALCCPARVSIMTGLHAHNHHVTDVGGVSMSGRSMSTLTWFSHMGVSI
jgi:hypothetical protein